MACGADLSRACNKIAKNMNIFGDVAHLILSLPLNFQGNLISQSFAICLGSSRLRKLSQHYFNVKVCNVIHESSKAMSQVFLRQKVLERFVIGVYENGRSFDISTPFMQCIDNGEHFSLLCGVSLFRRGHSARFKRNRS